MEEKNFKKMNNKIISPPKKEQIIEATLISKDNNAVFFDLGPKGIGIIYGREYLQLKDIIKNIEIGEKVTVKINNLEDDVFEHGYREVSIVKTEKEILGQGMLQELKENQKEFEAQVIGANRGGLLFNIQNQQAFLPASQLSEEHYPKVKDGDPQKILEELQKFIGKKMKVRLLNILPDGKIILTEKPLIKETPAKKFEVGDKVAGEISGITNFGVFVKIGKDIEGLVYPSEIPNSDQKPISQILKLGQKVTAKIIKIEGERIYLTLKI